MYYDNRGMTFQDPADAANAQRMIDNFVLELKIQLKRWLNMYKRRGNSVHQKFKCYIKKSSYTSGEGQTTTWETNEVFMCKWTGEFRLQGDGGTGYR